MIKNDQIKEVMAEITMYGYFSQWRRVAYDIFGVCLGIAGVVLGFIWFGWKLVLVVFLWAWAQNIQTRPKGKSR